MSSWTSNEYTYDDGNCVNLDFRCDEKPHCKDKSDELECRLIEEDKSYKKCITPPPIGENKKLSIELAVDIVAVGDIMEIESTIDVQFIMYMSWLESRLKFSNLISNSTNSLTPEEMDYLWIPKLIFYNTETRLETVLDKLNIISIKREGKYESLQNKRTNDVHENTISSSRFYSTKFMCIFDMRWYPFDTQKWSVVFVVDQKSKDFVDIDISELNFLEPKELIQYFVKKAFHWHLPPNLLRQFASRWDKRNKSSWRTKKSKEDGGKEIPEQQRTVASIWTETEVNLII